MVARQLLSAFLFNATTTTEIYTLSLHDALPISGTSAACSSSSTSTSCSAPPSRLRRASISPSPPGRWACSSPRSEERRVGKERGAPAAADPREAGVAGTRRVVEDDLCSEFGGLV